MFIGYYAISQISVVKTTPYCLFLVTSLGELSSFFYIPCKCISTPRLPYISPNIYLKLKFRYNSFPASSSSSTSFSISYHSLSISNNPLKPFTSIASYAFFFSNLSLLGNRRLTVDLSTSNRACVGSNPTDCILSLFIYTLTTLNRHSLRYFRRIQGLVIFFSLILAFYTTYSLSNILF